MTPFIALKTLTSFLIITNFSARVQAGSQALSSFSVVRPGEIPLTGVWPLITVSTNSAVRCANRCSNYEFEYNVRCGGFLLRTATCNSSESLTDGCQLLQFCDLASVVFSPDSSHCLKFYAAAKQVLQNLALNKPSYQSDTYWTYAASLANDGDNNTSSCTSMSYVHPWWAVDLGQPINVQMVKVTNDNNAYFDYRLDNFMVGLSNSQPTVGQPLAVGTDYVRCTQFNGHVPAGQCVSVTCQPSSYLYRYVIIQGMLDSADSLCLAEVEVFSR